MATMRTRSTRSKGPFGPFTDPARRAVVLAQEEARTLHHNYIGTEHLLLGVLHEGESVAALVLKSLGISLEEARNRVKETADRGQDAPARHVPFTPPARKVIEGSLQEALRLGHNHVGSEHLLLALLREGDGVAEQVLADLGPAMPRYGNGCWACWPKRAQTSGPSSRRTSGRTVSSIACAACSAGTASSRTAAPRKPPEPRSSRIGRVRGVAPGGFEVSSRRRCGRLPELARRGAHEACQARGVRR